MRNMTRPGSRPERDDVCEVFLLRIAGEDVIATSPGAAIRIAGRHSVPITRCELRLLETRPLVEVNL